MQPDDIFTQSVICMLSKNDQLFHIPTTLDCMNKCYSPTSVYCSIVHVGVRLCANCAASDTRDREHLMDVGQQKVNSSLLFDLVNSSLSECSKYF